jgi:hypothetical protein
MDLYEVTLFGFLPGFSTRMIFATLRCLGHEWSLKTALNMYVSITIPFFWEFFQHFDTNLIQIGCFFFKWVISFLISFGVSIIGGSSVTWSCCRKYIISWLCILSLGVKTSGRCPANKLAFSLLLLAHGPGVGDCFLIGGLAGNGLEVDLIGRHIELSCRLRFVT